MKYEFDGLKTEQFDPQDREQFHEGYNGILIDPESFTVELENKEVELHLYIEDIDMSEYEDTQDHYVTLGVIPSFKSLSESNQQTILNQFQEDERESIKADTMGLLQECKCYGFEVPLHTVTVKDPNEVEHVINSAIAVRFGVSGLIGFELDRPRNRIGNTGWDLLEDYCDDIDLIKVALARYNK